MIINIIDKLKIKMDSMAERNRINEQQKLREGKERNKLRIRKEKIEELIRSKRKTSKPTRGSYESAS